MNDGITTIGLDVHVKTITAAAITAEGEIHELGTFPNTPADIAKRLPRWGAPAHLAVCYEAGPCGYAIARQLEGLGIACAVVAPALIPRRPGPGQERSPGCAETGASLTQRSVNSGRCTKSRAGGASRAVSRSGAGPP